MTQHHQAMNSTSGLDELAESVRNDLLGRVGDLTNDVRRLRKESETVFITRSDSREDLARARVDLEKRIARQTRELTRATKALYEEILDRRRAEDSLREAEKKYRNIIENAAEGIYQSTPEGRYLSVNPALARMYGYDSPEALMQQTRDIAADIFVDPVVRERFKSLIESKDRVINLEYQVRRRDGGVLWISENARVVRDRRGQVLYYEGTVEDITARKEAEAARERLEHQLRQSQKMEAIGTLAGGIAHDFNNILGAIIGFTELALDDIAPESRSGQNLREILQAGLRAKDMVRQILAFSRQSDPHRAPVSLRLIVEEALKLLRATLPSTIQFDVEMALGSAGDTIVADATQIHQVIMNLGVNAGYAMQERGGHMRVTLTGCTLSTEPGDGASLASGPYLRLSVADTGHGMERSVLDRIFEPFYTTKPVGQGTGLGLSVVHGIVKNHGGEITVESVPGLGTTFHLVFPRAEPGSAGGASPSAPVGPAHAVRIIVVDDEAPLARMMEQKLERMGHRTTACLESAGALREFQAAPDHYDLVITDQTMPHLTGLDLAVELHRVRADLPIILCTGTGRPPTPAELTQFGIQECILKPVNFNELDRAIRRACPPPPVPAFGPTSHAENSDH